MYEKSPPPAAERLLRWATRSADRDCVAGDLAEEFALRAQRAGLARARRWYWWQVLRSVPAGLSSRTDHRNAGLRPELSPVEEMASWPT